MNQHSDSDQGTSPPVILCISHDPAFLSTLRRSLSATGFSVITTRSAAEGVSLTAAGDVDVVLCEYNMPQSDALAIHEQIANQSLERHPPMLVVADHYSASLLARCLTAGTAGLIARTDIEESVVHRLLSLIEDGAKRAHIYRDDNIRLLAGDTDPVTRIANRAHFYRRVVAESTGAYRDQTPFAVLMLRIDRADRLAASHGSERLDAVLMGVARLIEGDLRTRDCVGRYENHTFGITLPETPRAAATAVGQRLRKALATSEFGDLDHPITVTCSIGTACRTPGVQISPDELLAQALKACDAAESMGGDRVVSDAAFTGKPVLVLVGDSEGQVAGHLRDGRYDLRHVPTPPEAVKLLQNLPVAMVIVVTDPADDPAVDLLTWTRDRYPAALRVLITGEISPMLMERAVNEAAISLFFSLFLEVGRLPNAIKKLLSG